MAVALLPEREVIEVNLIFSFSISGMMIKSYLMLLRYEITALKGGVLLRFSGATICSWRLAAVSRNKDFQSSGQIFITFNHTEEYFCQMFHIFPQVRQENFIGG